MKSTTGQSHSVDQNLRTKKHKIEWVYEHEHEVEVEVEVEHDIEIKVGDKLEDALELELEIIRLMQMWWIYFFPPSVVDEACNQSINQSIQPGYSGHFDDIDGWWISGIR